MKVTSVKQANAVMQADDSIYEVIPRNSFSTAGFGSLPLADAVAIKNALGLRRYIYMEIVANIALGSGGRLFSTMLRDEQRERLMEDFGTTDSAYEACISVLVAEGGIEIVEGSNLFYVGTYEIVKSDLVPGKKAIHATTLMGGLLAVEEDIQFVAMGGISEDDFAAPRKPRARGITKIDTTEAPKKRLRGKATPKVADEKPSAPRKRLRGAAAKK